MKANEYIKKHGWDAAKKHYIELREAINQVPFKHSLEDFSNDLMHLINSHSYVSIHGLEQSKVIVVNAPSDEVFYSWSLGRSGIKDKTVHIGTLRKAIADVESCIDAT